MTDIEIIKTCGWNIQSEKDIWDSFNDWSLHRFVCIVNYPRLKFPSALQMLLRACNTIARRTLDGFTMHLVD